MIVEIHDGADNKNLALRVVSDGEGRYKVSSDRIIPRHDPEKEFETDDGLHVLALIHLYIGASDSQGYLTRRLKEREKETTNSDI